MSGINKPNQRQNSKRAHRYGPYRTQGRKIRNKLARMARAYKTQAKKGNHDAQLHGRLLVLAKENAIAAKQAGVFETLQECNAFLKSAA